jgi:hypothetical protein
MTHPLDRRKSRSIRARYEYIRKLAIKISLIRIVKYQRTVDVE